MRYNKAVISSNLENRRERDNIDKIIYVDNGSPNLATMYRGSRGIQKKSICGMTVIPLHSIVNDDEGALAGKEIQQSNISISCFTQDM